jgi:monoamine oxidase
MTMGHTSLMRWLVGLAADHAEAGRRRVDLSEVRARRLSRREFLAGAGALGVAACSAPALRLGRERPSVAIIGGGIAGLAAALTLADAGIASTLYDSSDRVGGRMHSDTRGYWNDGQISEWCGELIDSSHRTLLSLAQRFRLPITDLLAAQPAGAEPTCYLFDQYYPKARADFDFKPVHEALQHDLRAAGYPTTSPLGRLLDIAYAPMPASTAPRPPIFHR